MKVNPVISLMEALEPHAKVNHVAPPIYQTGKAIFQLFADGKVVGEISLYCSVANMMSYYEGAVTLLDTERIKALERSRA